MQLTDKQYALLLELYHEFNEAFNSLSTEIKEAFYEELMFGRD